MISTTYVKKAVNFLKVKAKAEYEKKINFHNFPTHFMINTYVLYKQE